MEIKFLEALKHSCIVGQIYLKLGTTWKASVAHSRSRLIHYTTSHVSQYRDHTTVFMYLMQLHYKLF
jgi:hypothetical protein